MCTRTHTCRHDVPKTSLQKEEGNQVNTVTQASGKDGKPLLPSLKPMVAFPEPKVPDVFGGMCVCPAPIHQDCRVAQPPLGDAAPPQHRAFHMGRNQAVLLKVKIRLFVRSGRPQAVAICHRDPHQRAPRFQRPCGNWIMIFVCRESKRRKTSPCRTICRLLSPLFSSPPCETCSDTGRMGPSRRPGTGLGCSHPGSEAPLTVHAAQAFLPEPDGLSRTREQSSSEFVHRYLKVSLLHTPAVDVLGVAASPTDAKFPC